MDSSTTQDAVTHTQGRMTAIEDKTLRGIYLNLPDWQNVGVITTSGAYSDCKNDEARANAIRLVSAWNACLGIDSKTLEVAANGGPDVREWFEAWSESDPERRHLERRIAITGARTTIETLAFQYTPASIDGIPLWRVTDLAFDPGSAGETIRQLAVIADAVKYLDGLGLIDRPRADRSIISFANTIHTWTSEDGQ